MSDTNVAEHEGCSVKSKVAHCDLNYVTGNLLTLCGYPKDDYFIEAKETKIYVSGEILNRRFSDIPMKPKNTSGPIECETFYATVDNANYGSQRIVAIIDRDTGRYRIKIYGNAFIESVRFTFHVFDNQKECDEKIELVLKDNVLL
jgi:hypothetical protein